MKIQVVVTCKLKCMVRCMSTQVTINGFHNFTGIVTYQYLLWVHKHFVIFQIVRPAVSKINGMYSHV